MLLFFENGRLSGLNLRAVRYGDTYSGRDLELIQFHLFGQPGQGVTKRVTVILFNVLSVLWLLGTCAKVPLLYLVMITACPGGARDSRCLLSLWFTSGFTIFWLSLLLVGLSFDSV